MAFFLSVEVESPLPPDEFGRRVLAPLRAALEREGAGSLLPADAADAFSEGLYEVAISATDQERCREIVAEVLRAVDAGG